MDLLTSYGRDYGKRYYKVSKMKRKHQELMVDKAYDIVDAWIEYSNKSKEEPLTIPIPEITEDSGTELTTEPEPKKVFEENM